MNCNEKHIVERGDTLTGPQGKTKTSYLDIPTMTAGSLEFAYIPLKQDEFEENTNCLQEF